MISARNLSDKWPINAHVKNATNYTVKNYLASGMGFPWGSPIPGPMAQFYL
jgi:hypothetical protein